MSSDSPACIELRDKIPADWEAGSLDAVTNFQEGPGILAKDFRECGVPLLRLRNIENPTVQLAGCNFLDPEKVASKWNHFRLQRGDLLISTSASLGRVSVVGQEAVGSVAYTGIIRFRSSDERLHHAYLRAFLSSKSFVEQAERMATGSVIKHFGPSHLRQMAITLPPIKEQVFIAELFDVLDDRITLLRETNATLEAIAQTLFKSWFVDFDPVRAKAEGRARQDGERSGQPRMPQASDVPRPGAEAGAEAQGQPEGAIQGSMSAAEGTTAGMPEVGQRWEQLPRMPKAAMDAATAALFPDSFEESELGLVPKGWTVMPIGEAVECVGGGTPDTKNEAYWQPEEFSWSSPKDLSGLQSPVLLSTERKLSAQGLAKVSSGLLPSGTLLMSSRAPIGYLAIAQIDLAVNQGYIAMLPGARLPVLYLLFWCQMNMEVIKGRANGSTFMEISKKAFRPIPALVPSAEVLAAFEQVVGPLFERLVANERQAQSLTQLRDTLLPRLISGQLRLPEAEQAVEEAQA